MLLALLSFASFAPAVAAFAAGTDEVSVRAARGHAVKPSPRAEVLGVAAYLLTVENLSRSIAFYRDVVGLSVQRTPERAVANPPEQSLSNTPAARFRSVAFANPASGPALVLEEYTGIPRRSLRPRAADPGAATVLVSVRDLAPVLTDAARAGSPIVTRGGRALAAERDGTQQIVLRDPDGFYVQLSQLPSTAAAGSGVGNVLSVRMQYTVAAPAAIVRFYHTVLGMQVRAGGFVRDASVNELFDTGGAQRAIIQAVPLGGSAAPLGGSAANDASASRDSGSSAINAAVANRALEFAVFRGIPRHTYSGRPQDAGTPAVALRVNSLPSVLRAIRASGTIIVSAGGQPLLTGHGGATILVRDPAGLLVQLVQETPAPRQ